MNTEFYSLQAKPTAPPIVFPVRYIDGIRDATRGSLEDLPPFDFGTSTSGSVNRTGLVLPHAASASNLGTVAAKWVTQDPYIFVITTFETVVETGDQVTFVTVGEGVDSKKQSAEDFVLAIQSALAEGAYRNARELASKGAQCYPRQPELEKYARVLAPPRVIRKDVARKNDLRINRDWLKTHGDAYRGKWIALHDGELLAVSDSLKTLMIKLNGNKDVYVTKVF